VAAYNVREAAHRAGLAESRLAEFVAAGVITASDEAGFSIGDVRRAVCVEALVAAGVPLLALSQGVAEGMISLDFLDGPEYRRLAETSDETFQQVAARSGLPLELLAAVRESTGSPPPMPDDYVRENELDAVPYLQMAFEYGMTPPSLERHVRVAGDGLRRVAETEADNWYRELLMPRLSAGMDPTQAVPEGAGRLADLSDRMVLALMHGRQANAWLGNVVRGFTDQLASSGLHAPTEHVPTLCFLDVTGYTRMTAERGDAAAAELAEQLSRIVERTSTQFGGKPVKWLGDGVMVYFDDALRAIPAALEMLEIMAGAGLPPAHVGIHSGEVIFNQGDYFGGTVNIAARIADFARPGEVLVSADSVAAAAGVEGVRFEQIGPVDLKGVDGPIVLFAARRGMA
jgi:adenylate cyclase